MEEAVLGEDPKEVEKNSLPVRVTKIIRNKQYTIVMTMCHAVLFISLISTLVFLLEACFHCVVTTVALSKSSCVAYGRSSK